MAGVNNAIAMAQVAFAIQLFGNICSWPLVDHLGRRPMIVGGMFIMTGLLLVIGGISTIGSDSTLKATVAFMTVWGFLVSLWFLHCISLLAYTYSLLISIKLHSARYLMQSEEKHPVHFFDRKHTRSTSCLLLRSPVLFFKFCLIYWTRTRRISGGKSVSSSLVCHFLCVSICISVSLN